MSAATSAVVPGPIRASRRFQLAMIAVTVLLTLLSLIGGEFGKDQPLHHIPTAAAVAILGWLSWRRRLSDRALSSSVAFVWLHVLGARYSYSSVPYDAWSQELFGTTISDLFGFERNHFDRVVHLMFGVLATYPQVELIIRTLRPRPIVAHALSLALVTSIGAIYEIIEWAIAMLFAPDQAERYNGQQGDVWDPQKDMLLAMIGALFTSALMLAFARRKRARNASPAPDEAR